MLNKANLKKISEYFVSHIIGKRIVIPVVLLTVTLFIGAQVFGGENKKNTAEKPQKQITFPTLANEIKTSSDSAKKKDNFPTPTVTPAKQSQTSNPTATPTNSPNQNNNSNNPTPTSRPTVTLALTPTPTRSTSSTPTPTFVPQATNTPAPTATSIPTPTPETSNTVDFNFTMNQKSSFTPNATGTINGKVIKNSHGYWDAVFSANFTNLMPSRKYQVWICGINCGSHTAAQFTTDSSGNGSFSNTTITIAQKVDPVNRIVVWENPPQGAEVPNDPTACFHISLNSPTCLSNGLAF